MPSLLQRQAIRNSFPWNDSWFFQDAPSVVFTSDALRSEREKIENDFPGFVRYAYKQNGAVGTCIMVLAFVLSEARFAYRRFDQGQPSEIFGTGELGLLERPWENGTTGELLVHMVQDASLAGNFFATKVRDRHGERVRRMRPDWVTIVSGSETETDPRRAAVALDARPVGYVYQPPGSEPEVLLPDEVVHFSPEPDPIANWRGMSWVSSVIREVQGDTAATKHKLNFFEHAATPGLVVSYDKAVGKEAFEAFVEKFKETHQGAGNAWKTLHLGGGADVETPMQDFKSMDFKSLQGMAETRIAARSGVGAVVAQFAEGLQGSSLNAGNFAVARRRFADFVARPWWRMAAASLETIAPPPDGQSQLWYVDRDVAALRDDAKDEATIRSTDARTITTLIRDGYEADAAVEAVTRGDLRLLEGRHTGRVSVQLHDEDETEDDDAESA